MPVSDHLKLIVFDELIKCLSKYVVKLRNDMPWCSNQPFSLPTDLVAQALHSSSVKTSERQLQQSFGDHLLAISFILVAEHRLLGTNHLGKTLHVETPPTFHIPFAGAEQCLCWSA